MLPNELILQVVQSLIEHDRWKVLEKHRHEKELKLLKLEKKPSKSNNNFNLETSSGECNSTHEGLIARAKVQAGVRKECGGDELNVFLSTVSMCGKRLERWPSARDASSSIKAFRNEFEKILETYPITTILERVESISPPLDLRIISEQIELAKTELSRSFSNSPLAKEFVKVYPNIDINTFENVYNKHRGDFVQAGIYILRREFKKIPPAGIHINPEHWPKSWPQYLPKYLTQWQKELKSIERRMQIAQRAWLESTY